MKVPTYLYENLEFYPSISFEGQQLGYWLSTAYVYNLFNEYNTAELHSKFYGC